MIKTLTSYLDYSIFAEIALVIFAMVFVAVVIRTLMTDNSIINQQASIVLNDNSEERA